MVIKNNRVAVLGFHDSSAGWVDSWFTESTGLHIDCFIHESNEFIEIDPVKENANRVSKRTEYPISGTFKGKPLIVSLNWIDEIKVRGITKVLPLTINNKERLRHIRMCIENNLELVSAIHPTTTILAGATIEPGVWINTGCLIGYKAEIESGVILNTRTQVDHHNVLKTCCQLDPSVVTAGNVVIGECSHIHTNATIINQVEIGESAIVGAGAVVLKNVQKNTVVAGVPAKVIRVL